MVVIVIIIVVIGLGISMYFANLPHLRLSKQQGISKIVLFVRSSLQQRRIYSQGNANFSNKL